MGRWMVVVAFLGRDMRGCDFGVGFISFSFFCFFLFRNTIPMEFLI